MGHMGTTEGRESTLSATRAGHAVGTRMARVYALCFVLAFCLALPGLWLGALMDDYIHLAVLDGADAPCSPFDLFSFAPGDAAKLQPYLDQGLFPWWTLPSLKIAFWRPLSSALVVLDHTLFGHHFVWWHLHSLLWYGLLILAWGLVLRPRLPAGVTALALVLFTVDEVHWHQVMWVANRNALIPAALGLLGMAAHMRWREQGWTWGLPLSLIAYATGLLGGESTLGILAYLGAYELFARRDAPTRRAASLMPAAILALAYLILYNALGYGAVGAGGYTDPVRTPWEFISQAPLRILACLGDQLLMFPCDFWLAFPGLRPWLAAGGAVALVAFAYLLRQAWPGLEEATRRTLRWTIPGAVLSLLPIAAAFPTRRLLLLPGLGASVATAAILNHWWQRRRTGRTLTHAYRALCAYLLVTSFVIAPLVWPAQSLIIMAGKRVVLDILEAAAIDDATASHQHLILPVAPDPVVCVYTPIVRTVQGHPAPAGWHVLSAAPFDHRLTRTGPNRLQLEVIGGALMTTEFERLLRSAQYPIEKGCRVKANGLTITVAEANEQGPAKLDVQFEYPLEHPDYAFLVWRNSALRKLPLPAVGESIDLPKEPGVLRLTAPEAQ